MGKLSPESAYFFSCKKSSFFREFLSCLLFSTFKKSVLIVLKLEQEIFSSRDIKMGLSGNVGYASYPSEEKDIK